MKPDHILICKDCGLDVKAKDAIMLRNRQTKDEHYVCSECIKNYNIKKPS